MFTSHCSSGLQIILSASHHDGRRSFFDEAASEDGSATFSGSEASMSESRAGSPAPTPRVSLGSLMDPDNGSGAAKASATLPCGRARLRLPSAK